MNVFEMLKARRGFYLTTDRLLKDSFTGKYDWVDDTPKDFMGAVLTPVGEYFYWNGEERTWHGAVEKAICYPTVQEAESQAVFAVALDIETAGHIRVIEAKGAHERERDRIIARAKEQEEKAKFDAKRFRLGPGEGLL